MLFTQWSGWRRDLLVGLVACAITVTVLVPLAWVLLRQEQQQAVAARDLAAQAVLRAEKGEAEAAKHQAQADHNFQLAQRAVDEYFTALADAEPGAREQARKLLEEAKKFYQRQE